MATQKRDYVMISLQSVRFVSAEVHGENQNGYTVYDSYMIYDNLCDDKCDSYYCSKQHRPRNIIIIIYCCEV